MRKSDHMREASALLAWMKDNGILHAQVGDVVLTRDPAFEYAQSAPVDIEQNENADNIQPPERGVYEDRFLWDEHGEVEVPRLQDVRADLFRHESEPSHKTPAHDGGDGAAVK